MNLKDLFNIKLESMIEKNTCFGRVGLKNLGNTCFMNSAIQCLSHCEDLTKYFLQKHHLKDINSSNKYGSSGQVASAYFELILNLWNGKFSYLSPGDFRQILVKIIKKFQGFSQQDSHELLTYLLDTLHEDLNRVTEKPYIELKEKFDSESDFEGSKRWWQNHLKRENSIIVDLFHGQYKSTISCPECDKISITYDPFMFLGLPISSNQNKLHIKYFPNFFKDLKHEYFNIEIPVTHINAGFFTVKDLKIEIHQKFGMKKNTKLIVQYPMFLLCYEAVLLDKDKIFKKVLEDETEIVPILEKGEELIIFEKFYDLEQIRNKNDYKTFYFNPIFLNYQSSMLIFTKKIKINLYYPILITISADSLLFDLYYMIFLIFRKVIPDIEKQIDKELIKVPSQLETICKNFENVNIEKDNKFNKENIINDNSYKNCVEECFIENNKSFFDKGIKNDNFYKQKFKTNKTKFLDIFLSKSEDESYLIQEFKAYFSLNEEFEFDENEVPFELFFFNNIPEMTGFSIPLFNQKPACEFCQYKNCEFCPVSKTLKMNEKLSKINKIIKIPRQICFLIRFKNVTNTKLYNNDNFPFDASEETKIYSYIYNNPSDDNKNDFKNNSGTENKINKVKEKINNKKINLAKNVTIYDCLTLFNQEEKLEKDNTWYCSFCKKHQEATKKMELYKAPHILIIQLKRFKPKSQNSSITSNFNGKNQTLVEYPLEGLDLRNFIVGENTGNAIYDLFAVSQHFGNLSSGHYTSLCKNRGKWIEFDDESISQAEEKSVVNTFAYLLFYKMRVN